MSLREQEASARSNKMSNTGHGTQAAEGNGVEPEHKSKKTKLERIIKKETSLERIVNTIKHMKETNTGLWENLRTNYHMEPSMIPERRSHLTGVLLSDLIGLSDIPDKMKQLFSMDERDRPALGMLNAESGSGKSSTFQYCEQTLNAEDPQKAPLTLAVTFNRSSEDMATLDAMQGLTMRIAERFLMAQGQFPAFREMWKTIPGPDIVLNDLIEDIVALTKRKLLILVDEPGLCGNESRIRSEHRGNVPEHAKQLVNTTSLLRTEDFSDHAMKTRFVFSSLKPVFDGNNALQVVTTSQGPIEWIIVPYVDKNTHLIHEKVRERLQPLEERMPAKDFDSAVDFILTMASGHWATLDAIIRRLLRKGQGDPFFDSNGLWLSTVYLQNVRDVVVQVRDSSAHNAEAAKHPVFNHLLALAILGIQVDPFAKMFKYGDKKTLNDLAYDRVVTNRIRAAEGNTFVSVIPRLSMLSLRRFCLNADQGRAFPQAIRAVLQHAGHDPTASPRLDVESAGIAFENMATAFVRAKFLALRSIPRQGWTIPMTTDCLESAEYQPLTYDGPIFFPGLVCLFNSSRPIQVPKTSRLLQIEGTGGYRGTTGAPVKQSGEDVLAFDVRIEEWRKQCLAEQLEFEGYYLTDLENGDIVCPGSKNQAHSDAMIITEFVRDGTSTRGLIFNQNKFSSRDASATVQVTDINAGLDLLVKERGLLFEIPGGTDVSNQIAKLRVEEENIVYCWNVLRKTATVNTLRKGIMKHAREIGFKGSVVVAVANSVSEQATNQYGDTFQDLALISCSG